MELYAIFMGLSPFFGLVISWALGLLEPSAEEEEERVEKEPTVEALVMVNVFRARWGGFVTICQ